MRRRRYCRCGEERNVSSLSGIEPRFLGFTIHSASATKSDDRTRTSAFHHGGPGSVPGQPTGVVWWTKGHWDRQVFLLVLPFPLSVPLHQHSVLIHPSITVVM